MHREICEFSLIMILKIFLLKWLKIENEKFLAFTLVMDTPKLEYLFTLFIIYSTSTLKYNHKWYDSRYDN